jgi:hypothetical protein
MSTKASSVSIGRQPSFGLRDGAMALIAATAVAALIVSILAVQSRGPVPVTVRPQAADVSIYERSAPLPGTGPDLSLFADAAASRAIYERSAPVTGTGPDLVYLAGAATNRAIDQPSGPITGTGPDLVYVSARG